MAVAEPMGQQEVAGCRPCQCRDDLEKKLHIAYLEAAPCGRQGWSNSSKASLDLFLLHQQVRVVPEADHCAELSQRFMDWRYTKAC